jgi:hypothetical protein
VSCLNPVSKLHTPRRKTEPKLPSFNRISWISKCSFRLGVLPMGKLYKTILLIAAPLCATTLQQLPLPEMAQQSTAIVRAKVTAVSGILRGSDVFTVYKFNPLEVWKAPASGAPTEVNIPGGVAGGLRQPVDGAPALSAGGEYVLFLWTSRTGVTQLIGLSQGLFDVRETPASAINTPDAAARTAMVWRSPASERMLDAAGRPVQDQAVSMTLTDLKAQVARALKGAR